MAPALLFWRRMRTNRRRANAGFTLIELLVVVSTIGVLAAIAIPQFASRQGKAFEARIMVDARNAAMAEEAYFDLAGTYMTGACEDLPGMKVSAGVQCTTTDISNGLFFEVQAFHAGAAKTCRWNTSRVPSLSCS